MTEFSTSLAEPEAPVISTQLDEGRPSDAPATAKEPEEKPRESRMDAIKRAAEDVDKANPPKDDKEAKEPVAKDEKAEDEGDKGDPKAEAAPKNEAQPKESPQRRQHIEAPDKFLPRAKELWQNVPHEVRSEWQRLDSERETELTQARESVKEFDAIKPYAEMARRSGTSIDVALGKYVQMEQALRSDPTTGFRELGRNMQMGPVQMIGHIMAAHNVRPEQLVQHMAQNPNDYTALARQQVQQQPAAQPNGEVEALKQQIAALQESMQHSTIEQTVIAPFAAENPRYHELQDTIAAFLKSDMIPKSLSLHDRLAAAYDMAVRISPSVKRQSASEEDAAAEQADTRRAGNDFGGSKSVRGAPATGVDTSSRRRSKMSRGDALDAAFADLGIA